MYSHLTDRMLYIMIGNVLSLKNSLNLSPDIPEVSQEKLLSLVAERLIDSNTNTDVISFKQYILVYFVLVWLGLFKIGKRIFHSSRSYFSIKSSCNICVLPFFKLIFFLVNWATEQRHWLCWESAAEYCRCNWLTS